MSSLSNTCEGSSGTAVSNANSGGPDQFNAVTVTGAGSTLTYDNAHVRAGSTAARFSLATVSSTAFLDWSALPNTPTANAFVRFYAYLTALPSVNAVLAKFLNGAAVECSIQLQTTGIIRTLNNAGGTLGSLTESFPLNQWVRVEFEVTGISGTTSATVACRIFSGANLETTSPDSGGSVSTAGSSLSGTVTDLRVGTSSAVTQTSAFTYWYDDVAYSDVATPGPSVTSVTWTPQLYGQAAPPSPAPWAQKDRRDANTAATAANPLVPPLDSAWQASAGYWHLYADGALRDRRQYFTQRPLTSDPNLLAPPGASDPTLAAWGSLQVAYGAPAMCAPRTWQPRQRARVSDPLLLTTAELENELLGGGQAGAYYRTPATHYDRREVPQQRILVSDPSMLVPPAVLDPSQSAWLPRWLAYNTAAISADRREAPQQRARVSDPSFYPVQAGIGAGTTEAWWGADTDAFYRAQKILASDPNLLLPPAPLDPALAARLPRLLALITPATHYDRRLVPQQRPYISDPSVYPSGAVTDPLTVAWGAGGPYWHLYNRAASITDRREVPQQRAYVPDPLLLAAALLESELLGGAQTWMHYVTAAYYDRREVPQQRPYISDPSAYPSGAVTDPLAVAWGAAGGYWHLYNRAADLTDRREYPAQRLYVSDPLLLTTAELENELLGGAGTGMRYLLPATHADRREVPQQRAAVQMLIPPVPLDPVLAARADLARRYGLAATHADRRLVPVQRLYFPVPLPPALVTYGTARQGAMTIPAATAGQVGLAHAEAGQMPLPRAEGGQP